VKLNCWEIIKCGREVNGVNSADFGVCAVFTDSVGYDGINSGFLGGRCCWAVPGTICGDGKTKSIAEKFIQCTECRVFERVSREEGRWFDAMPKPRSIGKKDQGPEEP
jgi:hypothetical protein